MSVLSAHVHVKIDMLYTMVIIIFLLLPTITIEFLFLVNFEKPLVLFHLKSRVYLPRCQNVILLTGSEKRQVPDHQECDAGPDGVAQTTLVWYSDTGPSKGSQAKAYQKNRLGKQVWKL